MNGPHDMGGFTGFGPVLHEDDEPVWHADWEPRSFALVLAMGVPPSRASASVRPRSSEPCHTVSPRSRAASRAAAVSRVSRGPV